MITQQQVADLQPGDVVRISVEGPVERDEEGCLRLSTTQTLAWEDSRPASWCEPLELTVVSRAPRPLYVNHPRTEPVPGDVVRDADRPDSVVSWSRAVGSLGTHGWRYTGSSGHWNSSMPSRLRLLVDGETGMTVPE